MRLSTLWSMTLALDNYLWMVLATCGSSTTERLRMFHPFHPASDALRLVFWGCCLDVLFVCVCFVFVFVCFAL